MIMKEEKNMKYISNIHFYFVFSFLVDSSTPPLHNIRLWVRPLIFHVYKKIVHHIEKRNSANYDITEMAF